MSTNTDTSTVSSVSLETLERLLGKKPLDDETRVNPEVLPLANTDDILTKSANTLLTPENIPDILSNNQIPIEMGGTGRDDGTVIRSDTSGIADVALKLQNAIKVSLTGNDIVSSQTTFDGTNNIELTLNFKETIPYINATVKNTNTGGLVTIPNGGSWICIYSNNDAENPCLKAKCVAGGTKVDIGIAKTTVVLFRIL